MAMPGGGGDASASLLGTEVVSSRVGGDASASLLGAGVSAGWGHVCVVVGCRGVSRVGGGGGDVSMSFKLGAGVSVGWGRVCVVVVVVMTCPCRC
jgi:hypothetical protein